MMKHLVFLTGAGMSVESGFKTFRGSDGLWENYPVEQIATHEGWERDPELVTNFYNMLRKKNADQEHYGTFGVSLAPCCVSASFYLQDEGDPLPGSRCLCSATASTETT